MCAEKTVGSKMEAWRAQQPRRYRGLGRPVEGYECLSPDLTSILSWLAERNQVFGAFCGYFRHDSLPGNAVRYTPEASGWTKGPGAQS